MGRFSDDDTHEMEGKILWQSEKSRLIEFTLAIDGHYKYFVPKKCTIDLNESDGEGNWMFLINDWWWKKRSEFKAND